MLQVNHGIALNIINFNSIRFPELFTCHGIRLCLSLAEVQCINLQKLNLQRYLHQMYIERMAYFRQTPPGPDRDGVFTFQTK